MPSQPSETETRRDWEIIQENTRDLTERLKILEGYLYRTTSKMGVALVFVPDRE